MYILEVIESAISLYPFSGGRKTTKGPAGIRTQDLLFTRQAL